MRAIFKSIKRSAKIRPISIYYPLVVKIINAFLHKKLMAMKLKHDSYSSTRVTKRLEKGRVSDGVDLWDLVLQQEENGEALARGHMDQNASLFMVAGTETTATLLSGLTYLLLTEARSCSIKKLNEEVRSAFASSDDISMEGLQGLPYLNACIKEGLRLYPPVPVGLPHRTGHKGSAICGYYVPPEVSCVVSFQIFLNRS